MRKDYWLVAMVRLAVCTPWRDGYEGGQGTGAGEGKCWVGVRVRVRARVGVKSEDGSEFARVGEWWRSFCSGLEQTAARDHPFQQQNFLHLLFSFPSL